MLTSSWTRLRTQFKGRPCHPAILVRSLATAADAKRRAFRSREAAAACRQLGFHPDEELGPIEVKEAFFRLAKRYHPDAGGSEADPSKFAVVRDAYKTLMESGTVEGVGTPSVKLDNHDEDYAATMEEFARRFDIRHTAPQHRQYLSFDGFGRGAPMQRQRQYDKHRAEQAAARAAEYRVEKLAWNQEKKAVVVDKKKAKDVKTRLGMERVVEDLIQESMKKGDFDTIEGRGKPLVRKSAELNPYSDFMTTKINEILINNGYVPEWVELGAEIRGDVERARQRLRTARTSLGAYPFEDVADERDWKIHVKHFEREWKIVRDKIWKFNLLVPTLNQQMVPTTAEKEVNKVLMDGDLEFRLTPRSPSTPPVQDYENPTWKPRTYTKSSSDAYLSPMDLFQDLITNLFRWK